jgi:hypothetical protein
MNILSKVLNPLVDQSKSRESSKLAALMNCRSDGRHVGSSETKLEIIVTQKNSIAAPGQFREQQMKTLKRSRIGIPVSWQYGKRQHHTLPVDDFTEPHWQEHSLHSVGKVPGETFLDHSSGKEHRSKTIRLNAKSSTMNYPKQCNSVN